MLECIVQQYHVYLGIQLGQALDALDPLLAHGQRDAVAILAVHLIWLVAYLVGAHVGARKHEALGRPLVSARQHRKVVGVAQRLYQIFDMRRLAGAPYGDVAHHDDRHVKLAARQQPVVKHAVAHPYAQSV